MKHKSKTFDKFVQYKNFVERHTRNNIRTLRSDQGGEYMSDKFNEFCEIEGIKMKCL